MKRIPSIKTAEGKLCQDFKSKCHTFIKAMYSKSPEISQDIDISNTQEGTQGFFFYFFFLFLHLVYAV